MQGPANRLPVWILSFWLAALIVTTVVTLHVIWAGPIPDVFISPDESNNRVGAELVASAGSPVLNLPFEDNEDLVHPRFWVSSGSRAISPHPPMIFFLYGSALMTGPFGRWFPYVFAGIGIAALSLAGILISKRRPIEGALLPLLALPVTYWILRPWSSFSPYLTSVALAVVFFLLSARRSRRVFMVLFAFFLALAGALRPDQMLYLYAISFIAALIVLGRPWHKIAMLHLVSAVAAVFATAWLNWQVTGDPLMTGYQFAARGVPPKGV